MPKAAVVYQAPAQSGPSFAGILTLIGLTIGGYALYTFNSVKNKSEKKDETAKDEASNIVTSLASQQASQFRKYIGTWIENTNEKEILALALKVKDWPGVVSAYSNLYSGDNIEKHLREVLTDSEYTQFVRNVKANGRKMNSVAWFTPVSVHKAGTILMLDDSTSPIWLTSDMLNLPSKVSHSFAKGKLTAKQKQVTFIQAVDLEYFSGSGKIRYYQVKFYDGKPYWVRWQSNIAKKTVNGLTGYVNQLSLNSPIEITV